MSAQPQPNSKTGPPMTGAPCDRVTSSTSYAVFLERIHSQQVYGEVLAPDDFLVPNVDNHDELDLKQKYTCVITLIYRYKYVDSSLFMTNFH